MFPHGIGTMSINLIDVVQHRTVPAALPKSFDDRNVRSHRSVYRRAVWAKKNALKHEVTIRTVKFTESIADYSPRLSEANGASIKSQKWKLTNIAINSILPCSPQSPQVSTEARDFARDIITQLWSGMQHISQHQKWFFIVLLTENVVRWRGDDERRSHGRWCMVEHP